MLNMNDRQLPLSPRVKHQSHFLLGVGVVAMTQARVIETLLNVDEE